MTGLIIKTRNDEYLFIEQSSIISVSGEGDDYNVVYGKAGCENRASLKKSELGLRSYLEFIAL